MLTVLLIIGAVYVFAKLIGFAFKFAWGIGKALFTFLFLPVLLIGILLLGLKYVVLPLLIIAIITIIVVSVIKAKQQ